MFKKRKKVWLFVLILILILACIIVDQFHYRWLLQNDPLYVPWKFTTPLPEETVKHLCEVFSLPEDDTRCQNNSPVYAPDFDDDVVDKVNSGELSTFTDWESVFGIYQTWCTPDKTEDFKCDYDFHGDGVFLIYVFFDSQGNMKDWRFSILDD